MIVNDIRKLAARAAAENYAPAPVISPLLYGVITAVLAGMTLWIAGTFYSVNFLLSPALVFSVLSLSFAIGIGLRLVRKRRNRTAYGVEYNKRKDASE